ncbi:hypothetical protein AXH35_11180 [Acidipropionibacterium acidipropionici]|uniref:RHS repeat protein n=1 Tax=Acidipropionibacterium acidipropionici TaxID=1748 RepID=A0AAC8YFU9_9ACTN|nr:hypothetical protein AXH35_11180 [Acidipropionibacterium acidipropionici]AOZ47380.1 hypothetical protein A8L58_12625 [Acidipropionibacterium acidipropionici]
MASSSLWSAGGNSGDFSWSYPIDVPSMDNEGGLDPEIALSYSSQAVDGRIASTNNQPGWIGQGWSYDPGFIERTYTTCSQLPSGKGGKTDDLCWSGDAVHLSLGSHSSELVRDKGTGAWRPKSDDGTRIERLTGAANGAHQGEHWRVTTTDGTKYYFGLGQAPGETTKTQAAWTVPVYGASAGDPCYSASGFAASRCDQAWRWNLDYVEDTRGNAMVNYYTPETNYYKANKTTLVPYTRGGVLARTEYGRRHEGQALSAASAKVLFTTAERCLPTSGFDCAESKFSVANAAHWPDTPADLACTATGTCANESPSFWSRKRLTRITTQVVASGTARALDVYDLNQTYPDQGDKALWLSSISHTGHGADQTTITENPVRFTGRLMANRVEGYLNMPPMLMWRLSQITDENGGITQISYTAPDCTETSVPDVTDLSANTRRCFPVRWTLPYETTPKTDFFHKYLVTEVRESDPGALSPNHVTTYRYVGAPAWGFDDNELVKASERTWGRFRGYSQVDTLTGDPQVNSNGAPDKPTLSSSWYLRGLNGDKLSSGGTRSVSVTNGEGKALTDAPEFEGQEYQSRTWKGEGGDLATSEYSYFQVLATTATRPRTGLSPLTATRTGATSEVTVTHLPGGTSQQKATATRYDAQGRPVAVTSAATGQPSTCQVTAYAQNTSLNITELPAREASYQGACPDSGTPTGTLLSEELSFYDGKPAGEVGTHGEETESRTAVAAGDYARTTTGYDAQGRTATSTVFTSTADATGRTTTTSYTPTVGGPVTGITTRDGLGNTTTQTMDLAGNLTKEAASTGATTETSYDALGRETATWAPGFPRSGPASQTTQYTTRLDGPEAVTTHTRVSASSGTTTVASVTLYDTFDQTIQTQTHAAGGGRVVNDTIYDSHGWPVRANNHWFTDGDPATALVTAADSAIDSRTVTSYDGAGLPIATTDYKGLSAVRTTRTIRSGNQITVLPPDGGTATTEITDSLGQLVKHLEYSQRPTVEGQSVSGGESIAISYGYDAAGNQTLMTDATGAKWTFGYDMAGRRTSTTDPDAGTSTTTYNHVGEVISTRDARGDAGKLTYEYDQAGRRTAMRGGPGNILMATWTYDTLRKGLPTSATSYVDGDVANPYTTSVTGYDTYGRQTGTQVSIPASQGKLAGTYRSDVTYTAAGDVATSTVPTAGGLSAEVLRYGYTDDGLADSMTGADLYVTKTLYNPLGMEAQSYGRAGNSLVYSTRYDPETLQVAGTSLFGQTARPQIVDTTYTRNLVGLITGSSTAMNYNQTPAVRTVCYAYDGLGRLGDAWTVKDACGATPTGASSSQVGGVVPMWRSWAFDAAGRRTSQTIHQVPGSAKPGQSTSYAAGAAGHAHATATATTLALDGSVPPAAGASQTVSYGYDAAGNTISVSGGGADQELSWDAAGRVSRVEAGAKASGYVYDAEGNLLIRTGAGGADSVLYAGDTEVHLSASGQVGGVRSYRFGDRTVAERSGQGLRALYTDQVGTGVASVD